MRVLVPPRLLRMRRHVPHRHDATPGLVLSIQTFGSYSADFHPHVHALVTDGAFTEGGEFLRSLLGWVHSGPDLIHALTTQIPDPGQHLVRYYGWYSNRSRGKRASGRRFQDGSHASPIPS